MAHLSRIATDWIKKCLGKLNLELRRIPKPSSLAFDYRELSLARPPADWLTHGPASNHYIRLPYTSRAVVDYLDERSGTDTYQREVYQLVRELADEHRLTSICDIGCGGGYKLLRYLGHLDTLGIEVPKTVEWLNSQYPDRQWVSTEFSGTLSRPFDIVMAADVIEHLPNPTELLNFINRIDCKFIVLSTPERNLLRNGGSASGPPSNPNHIREWSLAEFNRFASDHFDIVFHYVTNPQQATQCLVGKKRAHIS